MFVVRVCVQSATRRSQKFALTRTGILYTSWCVSARLSVSVVCRRVGVSAWRDGEWCVVSVCLCVSWAEGVSVGGRRGDGWLWSVVYGLWSVVCGLWCRPCLWCRCALCTVLMVFECWSMIRARGVYGRYKCRVLKFCCYSLLRFEGRVGVCWVSCG